MAHDELAAESVYGAGVLYADDHTRMLADADDALARATRAAALDAVDLENHKALGGRVRALFVPHSEFARTASVAAFAYRHVDPIRDRMCVVVAAARSPI